VEAAPVHRPNFKVAACMVLEEKKVELQVVMSLGLEG
jgi:hypothetical protein